MKRKMTELFSTRNSIVFNGIENAIASITVTLCRSTIREGAVHVTVTL